MAFDIEDLTTFYASLPSIFENNASIIPNPASDTLPTALNNGKTYQPIFGSFLFTDSEPFTKAAFVASSSPSMERTIVRDQQIVDNDSALSENTMSNSSRIHSSSQSQSPSTTTEDTTDMDDEDDFDGIPIRHDSNLMKREFDHETDFEDHHSEPRDLLDIFSHALDENHQFRHEEADDNSDSFSNGFTDEQEQQHDSITAPFLFKDIPDIDDPNGYEEDDDDDQAPLDPIDMFDQSDSIRSSSPDSLLSSSHLRDEDVDDDDNDSTLGINRTNDDEDDVTQWNDDFILAKTTLQTERPKAPLPPSTLSNINSNEQVDFIDSSRSNSRCSNASSDLSIGYTDQARMFVNANDDNDHFETSSDSDNDDDDDEVTFKNHLLNRENSEESSLQINLDNFESRSAPHRSNSSERSSSSIPDKLSITIRDEDTYEMKSKPLTATTVIHNDDCHDLEESTADQSHASTLPMENLFQSDEQQRKQEIIQDIINIRHLLNEHDNDDEFIAVIHNPRIFEELLYGNENKQVNSFT